MASTSSWRTASSVENVSERRFNAGVASPSEPPPSPTKLRAKPSPLLQSVGVHPSLLVGKVLTHVRRSSTHPALTLGFSDGTSFQILVDGYDPVHRGVPKALEMDASLDPLFDPPEGHVAVELPVTDCTLVCLTDKAFERKQTDQRWDQSHLAIAFKFGEESRWHSVWAALAEHDEQLGACTFRSYGDVYLERTVRPTRTPSPQKRRHGKRNQRYMD